MKKWGSNPRDGVLSGAGDFRYREVGGGVRKRQKQQTQIKTMKTKTIDSMNRTENRKVLDWRTPRSWRAGALTLLRATLTALRAPRPRDLTTRPRHLRPDLADRG